MHDKQIKTPLYPLLLNISAFTSKTTNKLLRLRLRRRRQDDTKRDETLKVNTFFIQWENTIHNVQSSIAN